MFLNRPANVSKNATRNIFFFQLINLDKVFTNLVIISFFTKYFSRQKMVICFFVRQPICSLL